MRLTNIFCQKKVCGILIYLRKNMSKKDDIFSSLSDWSELFINSVVYKLVAD